MTGCESWCGSKKHRSKFIRRFNNPLRPYRQSSHNLFVEHSNKNLNQLRRKVAKITMTIVIDVRLALGGMHDDAKKT